MRSKLWLEHCCEVSFLPGLCLPGCIDIPVLYSQQLQFLYPFVYLMYIIRLAALIYLYHSIYLLQLQYTIVYHLYPFCCILSFAVYQRCIIPFVAVLYLFAVQYHYMLYNTFIRCIKPFMSVLYPLLYNTRAFSLLPVFLTGLMHMQQVISYLS